MANYKKTKKIWQEWWKKHPTYGFATKSIEQVERVQLVLREYGQALSECRSLCELGVGNGRSLHYFHERFPGWLYFGNDIYPGIYGIIKETYPDVLSFAQIEIMDTVEYLRYCDSADVFLCFGHLMHIPDDVIGEVCDRIATKAHKFTILYEALPHIAGIKQPKRYKEYRFERNYIMAFEGFTVQGLKIDSDESKGTRHGLYLLRRKL